MEMKIYTEAEIKEACDTILSCLEKIKLSVMSKEEVEKDIKEI